MKVVGLVQADNGAPARMFGTWRPRSIEHEYQLSEELIAWELWGAMPFKDWRRGSTTHAELRPDSEVDGLMLEFDTGAESRKQVVKQARRYFGHPGVVMWIVPTMNRIEWIREVADKRNTLVKIIGQKECFSLSGRETSVDKVCAESRRESCT